MVFFGGGRGGGGATLRVGAPGRTERMHHGLHTLHRAGLFEYTQFANRQHHVSSTRPATETPPLRAQSMPTNSNMPASGSPEPGPSRAFFGASRAPGIGGEACERSASLEPLLAKGVQGPAPRWHPSHKSASYFPLLAPAPNLSKQPPLVRAPNVPPKSRGKPPRPSSTLVQTPPMSTVPRCLRPAHCYKRPLCLRASTPVIHGMCVEGHRGLQPYPTALQCQDMTERSLNVKLSF